MEAVNVVIVGSGPTGLTAAVRLAGLGVDHVVLDAAAEPTHTSKAALVHASTLELLAEIGAGDALVAAGLKVRRIVMRDRGKVLLRVRLDGLPSRYPFGLSVPQSTTEQVLLGRLHELSGTVRRSHRVTAIRAEGSGYLVSGVDGADVPFEIRARYVIGADGSRSTVRSAIGMEFAGETYASQFVLADVGLAPPAADDEATIHMSPDGVTVIGRLPSGNHRIVATIAAGTDVPEAPDRAFVDALLRDRGLGSGRLTGEPAWSSRFRVHHRVAERFRDGGVFLAGDAAHVHSPAAGQGMNTGIADAFDLSTRLAAVVTGQAQEPVLDAYETNRRAAALEVVRFTDRMTRIAMLGAPPARLMRRVLAGTVGRLAPVQHRMTMWITGLQRSPLRHDLPRVTRRPAADLTAP
jgi:2-polyprenyl-6-methoxyphenol hydroxylase-like FAD-dependent oxidoreductase